MVLVPVWRDRRQPPVIRVEVIKAKVTVTGIIGAQPTIGARDEEPTRQ
jgi:hypothetical protein